jgi:LuxR family transcriptional regulator, maltose regulon positive regulatory protein
VVRDRLLGRLRPESGRKLVLVAAPAGSGKTTLLGTWRDTETARRPVAWLTLDERDNDPVVLWSHVIEALRRVSGAADVSAQPEQVGPAGIVDVVLPRLVNRLAEGPDVGLILDDFHRLSVGPARESVVWFLDHAPPSFELVISSRTQPALPIAALRAHGELLELRADELNFTTEEADAFLNGHLDLDLAREDIDHLVERTEGWPAGLYLAALSLQGVEDGHAFLRTFSGANRYVVDFLIDEVLQAMDPATQVLMLRASILGRLCGPLCDAVLERGGCGELLAGLSRTNLFLIPLDDRGEWYRFHQLFAHLLRVELEHREPGLAPALHRRAFEWYRDHGSLDEAIEHAVGADAFLEAGELIAAVWGRYTRACRYATVLAWLRRFPVEVVRESQQVLLVYAWVLSLSARREEAARAIARVEELGQLHAGPLPDGFSSPAASLATLNACLPWGDVGLSLENGLRAAELEGPDSRWWPTISCALGVNLYFSGRVDEADRWLEESAPPAAWWMVGASSAAYRSMIAGEQGRLADQASLAEQGATVARESGLEDIVGEVFLALAQFRVAQGELDEALPLVERGVAAVRRWGQPTEIAHALICHASVLRAIGDGEALAVVISEARAVVDSCPDPGVLQTRLSALERAPRAQPDRAEAELSQRELLVLRMLRGSMSQRDIGRELYLSRNTVHTQTTSIYRKLGASCRAEALQRARELGLI